MQRSKSGERMKNVLVLGGTGLLGSSLIQLLRLSGFECFSAGRTSSHELVIRAPFADSLQQFLVSREIDVVVNLVALTDVDECQVAPFMAYQVNAEFVENVISAISAVKGQRPVRLLHISTDQVYSGEGPHIESSAKPINVYGLTKYLADKSVSSAGGLVLRTNFFGKSKQVTRTSFSDWVLGALSEGTSIPVFHDVLISAISIPTLCEHIRDRILHFKPGIYNLGTSEGYSKADLAFQLAERLGLEQGLLRRTSVTAVQFAAVRPNDMRMNVSLYAGTFDTELPDLSHELDRVVDEYDELQGGAKG